MTQTSGLADGKARITLQGEFTAAELDDVLQELATLRSGMEPAIPDSPGAEASVLEQKEPLRIFRTLADGGLRIWLRHDGFGWMPFTLNATERAELADFLGKKLGHSHTAH
ncbi:hypothetical protein [Xanthomonas axonopodis]